MYAYIYPMDPALDHTPSLFALLAFLHHPTAHLAPGLLKLIRHLGCDLAHLFNQGGGD